MIFPRRAEVGRASPVAPFRAFLQTRPRPPGVPFPVVPPFLRPILRSPPPTWPTYRIDSNLGIPCLVPSFRGSYPIIPSLLPDRSIPVCDHPEQFVASGLNDVMFDIASRKKTNNHWALPPDLSV